MIDYINLGATLFVPATHKDLETVMSGEKYKNLGSMVVDTEDSIDDCELESALECLEKVLVKFEKSKLLVFVRPRNIDILERILKFQNIDKIDGFILPKFSLKNANSYLQVLHSSKYFIMPSVEGKELFNSSSLRELKDILLPQRKKILLVRFGLEDMLKQLRMRRSPEDSLFDLSSTSSVIGNFLAIFKSAGFEVSAGVYPYFKDDEGFKKDVLRDLKEGLFSKTVIHPNQIAIINELYKVSQEDYDEAYAISIEKTQIGSRNGKMLEKNTMTPYSKYILRRAELYGIKE